MDNYSIVWDKAMYIDKNLPDTPRMAGSNVYPLRQSISPHPFFYEKVVMFENGTVIHFRPSSSEDQPALRQFFEALSLESIFNRFGQCQINMTHDHLAQLCQADNDRDFIFLAVVREEREIIIGEVQLNRLANLESAEVSFIVADQWQGKGIGNLLMELCMVVAKDLGLKTLVMEVLESNTRMKRFGYKYGFRQLPCTREDDIEEVLQVKIGQAVGASNLIEKNSRTKSRLRGCTTRLPNSYCVY